MIYLTKSKPTEILQWSIDTDYMFTVNEVELVHRLSASDAELDFIRDNFSNIPFYKSNCNIWYGDTARFIAMGIRLIINRPRIDKA
jgi:hypothetical protein